MPKIIKVIITDGEYKHTSEIVDEIKKNCPEYKVFVSIDDANKKKYISNNVSGFIISKLNEVDYSKFDVVIPVSANATAYISKLNLNKSLVVDNDLLSICFDKFELASLCNKHNINYPRTIKIESIQNVDKKMFPSVIKSRNESDLKFNTIYLNDTSSLEHNLTTIQNHLKDGKLIQQSLIDGNVVRGYFGLCVDGINYCEYMHERIRTWPVEGGSSTSAKSIFDNELKSLSQNFIKNVKWQGPIMLEYMYNTQTKKYTLIEINPKFWGSLGLGMKCGLKFGTNYCNAVLSEPLDKNKGFIFKQVTWPFDGDIVNILKQKKYSKFFEYFKSNNYIIWRPFNLGLFYKIFWTLKKVFVND